MDTSFVNFHNIMLYYIILYYIIYIVYNIQAHVPTYCVSWMTGIVNPIIYVAFNPGYRLAFKEGFSQQQTTTSLMRRSSVANKT